MLSLYLALYRPVPTRRTASNSPWLPYLRTLPETFRDWHPLTWTVSPTAGRIPLRQSVSASNAAPSITTELASTSEDLTWTTLRDLARDHLPPVVKTKLEDVSRRYERDKERVVQAMQDLAQKAGAEPAHDWVRAWEEVVEEDFLWGWLNGESGMLAVLSCVVARGIKWTAFRIIQ